MSSRSYERRMVGPVAVIMIALTGCSSGAAPTSAPTATQSKATSVPTPSASSSAEPSPTVPVLLDGGHFAPRTYTTLFEPAVTLTFDGYGESHVDSPSWIDVEFEGDPTLEIFIFRLDEVFDPKSPPTPAPESCETCFIGGKLIDPPKDLAAWLAGLPGVNALAPTKTVRIGGLDATQLDVRCVKDVSIGPLDGFGQTFGAGLGGGGGGTRYRLIAVTVSGRQILIAMGRGTTGVEDFDASMQRGQPFIDSIVWR